ncbi:MAG: T9SS type A sorting domain-containing protein, partial [Candidatus Eiseniibacteriota bacterium]
EVLPNDFFTPGTRVEYFLKAKFSGGGSEFLLPDTTGGNYLEFEMLPMMELVGEEIHWPCLILASHSVEMAEDGTYRTEVMREALDANGFTYDEYNRLDPGYCSYTYGAGIGRASSGGGYQGPGATVQQLAAHRGVIVSGGSNRYTIGEHDMNVLDGWLAASDSLNPRFLWINGDEAVRSLSSWGSTFLGSRLCASYVHYVYFLHSGDETYCLPMDGWSGGRIECTGLGGPDDEQFVLAGNRCSRQFDVTGASGIPGCSGAIELAYNETLHGETYAAAVSGVVEESGGPWYRSLIEGYDFTSIRSDASLASPECGPDTASAQARAAWAQCVLLGFGHLSPGAYCDSAGWIGVDDPSDGKRSPPAYVTQLQQSFPNPMNPTATIQYSIGTPGKVMLRIFDVSGRVTRTLVDESMSVGEYQSTWDGKNDRGKQVGSGVYFYQLEAPNFRSAKKIVILQ